MSDKIVDVLDVLRVARIGCKLNAGNGDAPILKRIDEARLAIMELIDSANAAHRDALELVISGNNTIRLGKALAAVTPNPRSRSQEQEREE